MTIELGHFALIMALVLAGFQSVIPMIGAKRGDARLMATASPLSMGQFLLVAFSFAVLTHAYLVSDFSVQNVWENSHTDKPLLYKFTGTWGNHEGSMLLWVLILTLFGASVAAFGRHLPDDLKANVLGVQSWVAFAFILFTLVTSNPFWRVDPAPIEGQDLNPLLQDIGLAIHPPLLYLGYVGFSITFAFAIAALISGRVDAAWARWVRPWALAAWMFLTIGISMGSYWAYYELGWGGWWFWDPVENASLMPWLAGTALLHSAIVVEKRGALKIWTILLAIITFSLSLLGTFLVRSGVLTSVHSFASDPTRGLFILIILMVFVGGAFALFAYRAPSLTKTGIFAPVSREGTLVMNNLFLSASTAVVLIGTLYPLVYEAITDEKISFGPPFFNLSMLPLAVPLLALMPFGPLMPWKRGDLLGVSQRLATVLGLSLIFGFIAYLYHAQGSKLAPLGLALGFWVIFGAFYEVLWRAKAFRAPLGETMRRLRNLPSANWGSALGHAGMGVTILGVVAVSAWADEKFEEMSPGSTMEIAGYTFTFTSITPESGSNYNQDVANLAVTKDGQPIATLRPAKRIYPARQMPTTESSIHTIGFSQLYASIGEVRPNGAAIIRLYWKPWVTLIWLGSIIMFIGGAFSLADRRLRIGMPSVKKQKMTPQAAE